MVQKVSDRVLDRISTDNPYLSSHQLEVDQLVDGFLHQATDFKSIAAMTVGGLAYRLGRLGSISTSLGRIASMGIGLGTEVSAFEVTNRTLQSVGANLVFAQNGGRSQGSPLQNLWRWDGPGGLKQGLLSSWVSFGTLKGFGKLTQGQNLILQHGAQDLGMVLGHQLVFHAGMEPRPEGNLAEQLLRAEVTNLQLSAGTALAHRLAPRVAAWENPQLESPPTPRTMRDFAWAGAVAGSGSLSRTVEAKDWDKHFHSEMSDSGSPPAPVGNKSPDKIQSEGLPSEPKIQFPSKLIERLRKAKRVTVLTGAGLSAESGIPTFRDGAAALWSNVSMEEVATPEAFTKDPAKVWRWHAEQFNRFRHAKPNAGHFALAEMEKRFANFTVITQNIDGLHQVAGSKKVIELHGSLLRTRCPMEDKTFEVWNETGEDPPRCPDCSGPLRHDVIWFKEKLPTDTLNAAIQATDDSEVFLSIGTSSRINPAAALAHRAVSRKQVILEINPNKTLLTPWATFSLRGSAGTVLPDLLEALDQSRARHPPAESDESLAVRFRVFFPLNYRKKIIDSTLGIHDDQPRFKERLLEAYAQDPERGTFQQLMTIFAIQDLFYGDATGSSLGSFDAALLQTLIRRAAAEDDPSRRAEVFQTIFRGMENDLNRKTLTTLFDRFGYEKDLRISEIALFTPEFSKLHEPLIRELWKDYRDRDFIPLMNLIHELCPTDPVKQRRLIRILSQSRQSPLYVPRAVDMVLDHARNHPLGKLILKRMLQIFIVEDGSGKLRDLIEDGPKTNTMMVLREFHRSGLSPEEIAHMINGSHHTAYLDDIRVARKIVSTLSDIDSSLSNFSARSANLARMHSLWENHLSSGGEITPSLLFQLMGDDPEGGRTDPLAKQMSEMVKNNELEISFVSNAEFEDITSKDPVLKGCNILFFIQSIRKDQPHQIVIRDLLDDLKTPEADSHRSFGEILQRVKGLSHEGSHLRQALGKDESMVDGSEPFRFDVINRSDRLSSEIMAFLDQTRWDVKNSDIEYWTRSMRLGLNLPLYFLLINDRNIFAETNKELVKKTFE